MRVVTVRFFVFFFFKQKTAYEMLRSLVGSEMCIRDSPCRAQLALDAQVPLIEVRRLHVERKRHEPAVQREVHVRVRDDGKRISAGGVDPWIVEGSVVDDELGAERRTAVEAEEVPDVRQVVEDAVRTADRHPAVAFRIPHGGEARREVVQAPLADAVTRVLRITLE